jgi:hypothetical protein
METFVYIGGRFHDRVSNKPEEVATSLGARIVSCEEFDHEVCGRSVRCDLSLEEISIPKRMSARTMAGKLQVILNRMTTDPEVGGWLVSPALRAAIEESIPVAMRGDWRRLAALLRVKSYICGVEGIPSEDFEEPFWEDTTRFPEGEPTVYGTLDSLQFHAAMRAGTMPAGMTMYGVTERGAGVVSRPPDHDAEDPSPTIRLMRECDLRYAQQAGDQRHHSGEA